MARQAEQDARASAEGHATEDAAPASAFWAGRLSAALLDETLPTPLYHQIYLVLRGIIRQAEFGPETLLPGELGLARLLGVSRITVKRALNELAGEKLVSRHRGRGTLVTARAQTPLVRSSFDNLLESLQQMGLVTEIELLETTDVRAGDAGVAAQMEAPVAMILQRVVRRRMLEGEPLSYLITYTPQAIALHYTEQDLASTSFLELLDRAGAAPFEAEQWITAVSAEPRAAAALDVSVAAPLLKIERVMRDADGAVVQLTHGFYRPDRFQYHVRNAPVGDKATPTALPRPKGVRTRRP